MGHHKVMSGSQPPSYMTLIGVYSTVHLMYPNYCHVTTVCVCVCVCVSYDDVPKAKHG